MEKKEKRVCGAKNRRGEPCKRSPMPNGRCRYHGGMSLSGSAAPSFKHGRYSKYLPRGLDAIWESAQHDPELLSLAEEIRIVETRMKDLFGRLGAGESGKAWVELNNHWNEYLRALGRHDRETANEEIGHVGRIIKKGFADWNAWREIGEQIDRRQRLATAEHKRLTDLDQMIPAERASLLFHVVSDIINRNVSSSEERKTIAGEIRKFVASQLGGFGIPGVEAGSRQVIDVGK